MNPDQQFRLSIHAAFTDKPGKGEHGRLETSQPWQPKQFTLQRLLAWVKAGHAWIAGVSTDGRRAGDCIEGAELLVLDIDGDITIEKFWELGAVKRHCLATYTSVSHQSGKRIAEGKPCDDSYRAIFSLGKFVTDRTIYRQAHYELEAALGIELSDHAGQDPERLWYGATTAQIQLNPDATDLPWDLLENAELESRTQRDRLAQAERRAAAVTDSDRSYDIARLRWVIPQLAPSVHGGGSYGYQDYWFQMLAGCASDWDSLADVFTEWHERGEHSTGPDRQQLNSRRISRVRGKSPARIFEFAKEQIPGYPGCLPEAIKALNPQRQRRTGAIASSFSRDEAEFNVSGPPKGPGTSQAQGTNAFSGTIASASPDTPPSTQSTVTSPTYDEIFEKLYLLRTKHQFLDNGILRTLTPSQEQGRDDELVTELMASAYYARTPGAIDARLLRLLTARLGLEPDVRGETRPIKIRRSDHADGMQFIINDWLLENCDHLIYGPPGSGKTQLALHIARAALGDPRVSTFLDSGPLKNSSSWQRSRILFIESDMGEVSKNSLIDMMVKTYDWSEDLLEHIDILCKSSTDDTIAWQMSLSGIVDLDEKLKEAKKSERPYRLIVIDALKSVCPDNIRVGQNELIAYFKLVNTLVRTHGASLLWLHHQAPETKRVQGVSAIPELTNAVIHIAPHPEKKGLTRVNIMKLRGQGISREITIKLFGETYPQIIHENALDSSEADQKNQLAEAILVAIARCESRWRQEHPDILSTQRNLYYDGASSTEIIAELLNDEISITDRRLREQLKVLTDSNQIERRGHTRDTTYRLKTSEDPSPGPMLDF